MTEEQAQAEFNYCLAVGLMHHPDIVKLAYDFYGAGTKKSEQCIAELVNFYELKRLPRWACVIEQVIEEVDGSFTFVHRDSSRDG